MPRRKSPVLTDHELRLMEVLWRLDEATVADVVDALPPPPLTYSTVLTTLRTLEQKGYIAHREEGRAYVYRAVVERERAAKSALTVVLDRFFGNSPGALAVALFDDASLSAEEVDEITRVLASRKRGVQ